jgi:protein TonB
MDQQNPQNSQSQQATPAAPAGGQEPVLGSLSLNIEPWYVDFLHQIRDLIRPEKLPPLQVTSKPVAVKDLWEHTGRSKYTTSISILVHVVIIALLVIPFTLGVIEIAPKPAPVYIATDLKPYELTAPPAPQKAGGGGGGGDRSPLPASKGALPKAAKIQLAPPQAVIKNPDPIIPVTPTIIAPPDIQLPQVNMDQWGDPLATGVLASNGPGIGGGIGSGVGTGVGPGKGPGFGPGEGGGAGGGVFRVGGGVSAPRLIHKVDPEYSEQARKSKFQGAVVLSVVVQKDGSVRDIRVVRSLGLGLDEKAIEAVKQWRFQPGEKNGQAVDVMAQVEVTFRLL